MTENLRFRVAQYRTAVTILREMVLQGVISEKDYVKIDTILPKKFGLDSSTIFR